MNRAHLQVIAAAVPWASRPAQRLGHLNGNEKGTRMQRIDKHEVELSANEMHTSDVFNAWLDKGMNIPTAACYALNDMRHSGEEPSDEFIEYLSEGTCQRSRLGFILVTS